MMPEQTQPSGQLTPLIGEQLPPQVVTQVQVVASSSWGAVQVMVGSQTHPQVVGSCTLPDPQVVAGHSQTQLEALRTFGAVQVIPAGQPQVHEVGSSTWGAVQLGTQALVPGQTSCPAGHSQAQVLWLRTFPPPQGGSQAWLPTQNSVLVGQPSQAQVLALKTVGSGQSYVVWGQVH